jgi:hypothetical protein
MSWSASVLAHASPAGPAPMTTTLDDDDRLNSNVLGIESEGYSQHFPSQPQLRHRVCACSCWSGASHTGHGAPAT